MIKNGPKPRGFHTCEICISEQNPTNTKDSKFCGSQYFLSLRKDVAFISPANVIHYVKVHNYKPPEEVINWILIYGNETIINGSRFCCKEGSGWSKAVGDEYFKLACMNCGKITDNHPDAYILYEPSTTPEFFLAEIKRLRGVNDKLGSKISDLESSVNWLENPDQC